MAEDITRFDSGALDDTILAGPATGTAIPVSIGGAYSSGLVLAGIGETNTLAAPLVRGQQLKLYVLSFVALATRIITCAQALNQAAATIITFTAADQYIVLEAWPINAAGTTLRWRIKFNGGATIS